MDVYLFKEALHDFLPRDILANTLLNFLELESVCNLMKGLKLISGNHRVLIQTETGLAAIHQGTQLLHGRCSCLSSTLLLSPHCPAGMLSVSSAGCSFSLPQQHSLPSPATSFGRAFTLGIPHTTGPSDWAMLASKDTDSNKAGDVKEQLTNTGKVQPK